MNLINFVLDLLTKKELNQTQEESSPLKEKIILSHHEVAQANLIRPNSIYI